MANVHAMEQTKVINGNFAKLYHQGEWLSNVKGVEATVEINYEEIPRSGTRRTGHKATAITMNGSITAYYVTKDLKEAIGTIMSDDSSAFVTELHVRHEDPENPDAQEWYVLEGVQFETIPLVSAEVGSIVEEEYQFLFDNYKIIES